MAFHYLLIIVPLTNGNKNMELEYYQHKAKETIQKSAVDDRYTEMVPFLGIIGEIGSVVTQLKIKLKDGESYVAFKSKLAEELGDVLWYVSAIATQNNLNLDEIAQMNLD